MDDNKISYELRPELITETSVTFGKYFDGVRDEWRKLVVSVETEAARAGLKALGWASPEELSTLRAERDGLAERLKGLEYYVNNPSAWDSYSENVSEAIRRAVAPRGPEGEG